LEEKLKAGLVWKEKDLAICGTVGWVHVADDLLE